MKYRAVMTVAAIAGIAAGLAFGLEGPQLLRFYGIAQPPGFTEPNMSFYRTRSFVFVIGMVFFAFSLVTGCARKITDPVLQRFMAVAHFIGYLAIGLITLAQAIALWDTYTGWITAEYFIVWAGVFGYLGFVVLADTSSWRQYALNGDTASLHERWKHEIGEMAVQQERNRLARELHDSIKQQIFTIGVSAAAAQARWEKDPAGARIALEDVRGSAHEAMAEMEAMLQHLSPAPLENIGLVEALRKQCEALQYRTGTQVTSEFTDLPENNLLPPGTQEAVFRIAQEALANIARHARAHNVKVRLYTESEPPSMILQIEDDGQGFTPGNVTEGMGTANMRARTREIGGRAVLRSEPGKGTQVSVQIPLLQASQMNARRHWIIGAIHMLTVILITGLFFVSNWNHKVLVLFAIPFAMPSFFLAVSRFTGAWKIVRSSLRESSQ